MITGWLLVALFIVKYKGFTMAASPATTTPNTLTETPISRFQVKGRNGFMNWNWTTACSNILQIAYHVNGYEIFFPNYCEQFNEGYLLYSEKMRMYLGATIHEWLSVAAKYLKEKLINQNWNPEPEYSLKFWSREPNAYQHSANMFEVTEGEDDSNTNNTEIYRKTEVFKMKGKDDDYIMVNFFDDKDKRHISEMSIFAYLRPDQFDIHLASFESTLIYLHKKPNLDPDYSKGDDVIFVTQGTVIRDVEETSSVHATWAKKRKTS